MAKRKRNLKLPNGIDISTRNKWEAILKDVEKHEVPINVIELIDIFLVDGSRITVDVLDMLDQGVDPVDLQDQLNDQLDELGELVDDIDFFVSLERVATIVQPATTQLLGDL